MSSTLLILIFATAPVLSLAFETRSLVAPPSSIETPRITTPPEALHIRDGSQPAALCGYIDYTFPWACDAFSTCFYNTDISGVGCCRSSSCNYATGCVPSAAISTQKGSSQDYVITCSNSMSPYCGTATFDGDFYRFTCLSSATPNWSWFVFLTSSQSGQPGSAATISKRLTGTGSPMSTSVSSTGSSISGLSVTQAVDAAPSQVSAASPSSTQSSSTTDTSTPSTDNGPNIGAIVGGVFGGLFGVAFICKVLFDICGRRKRKEHVSGDAHVPDLAHDMHGKSELDAQNALIVAPVTSHGSLLHGDRVPLTELEGGARV